VPWKVYPIQYVTGVYTEACACAAFANAHDATIGPLPPGGYRHYYYNADYDIVCSSGTGTSCAGEEDPLNPPIDMNEDDWVARYHEHIWRRAAGQVGPIKTIPTYHRRPVGPACPIPALDTKLPVTSKVRHSDSAAVALDNAFLCSQASEPPRPRHWPAKETA
jgi:hypothetical protein